MLWFKTNLPKINKKELSKNLYDKLTENKNGPSPGTRNRDQNPNSNPQIFTKRFVVFVCFWCAGVFDFFLFVVQMSFLFVSFAWICFFFRCRLCFCIGVFLFYFVCCSIVRCRGVLVGRKMGREMEVVWVRGSEFRISVFFINTNNLINCIYKNIYNDKNIG